MIERAEQKVIGEIGRRLVRVDEITPSLAISCARAHLDHAARPDADLDDPLPWLSVAAIAAKQAVLATVRKARDDGGSR